MHVAAFSSPPSPDWRWRIVGYAGEMVAESHQTFPTIAAAVANGTQRLLEMNVVDRGGSPSGYRRTSQRRRG
jgi:hypothetical protein